jgi:hypothetical protein
MYKAQWSPMYGGRDVFDRVAEHCAVEVRSL